MDSSVAEKKMKVVEFLEIEVEPGLIYELINAEIVKKSTPGPKHQRTLKRIANLTYITVLLSMRQTKYRVV